MPEPHDMENDVSDAEMAKCFGSRKNCARHCRLKEICLGKHREEREERNHARHRETVYIDSMDAEGDHVAPDWPNQPAPVSRYDAEPYPCAPGETLPADDIREMLRRLGEMYVNDPTGYDMLFFKVLADGNQAALARKRGCTKQNINKCAANGGKRLEAYRAMMQKHPECRLTPEEIAVYHFVGIERFSYRQTGIILGISKDKVRKIAFGMTEKGFSCAILTEKSRIVKIFAKIRKGVKLNRAEKAIFEAVCAPGKSLRKTAKEYKCSYGLIRKIRLYAAENRLLTPCE